MVSYNPKSWFGIIFQLHKYDTFRQLLPTMTVLAIYTALISFAEIRFFELRYTGSIAVHSLVGFVISLLLVFRTNTAYERWWEGRKQWGAMVNNTRNLSIKLSKIIPENDKERRDYIRILITNYVFSLKEHLRNGVKAEELITHSKLITTNILTKEHIPNAIAAELYGEILALKKEGYFSEEQQLIIDNEFSALTDIMGACERIKKTPIPFIYSAFIKKFIFIYVMSLPFSLLNDFRYATVAVVPFIFYILASLEIIAEEIEDPFGTDPNDLPTDQISETIKRNLVEIFG